MRPKILVFASGSKNGGGSGFESLFNATKTRELDADIVGVISNHENGGVRQHADMSGVAFTYFAGPYDAEEYQRIVRGSGTEWVALSGWLKMVRGLDPQKTFNIHPALLSLDQGRFGGPGLYGHHVHDTVKTALDVGEITESGCTMHFVTDEYDRGPVFFEYRVPLEKGMSAEEIQKRVNLAEHEWQPRVTNMVVHGEISWDGKDPSSLVVPKGYAFLPQKE